MATHFSVRLTPRGGRDAIDGVTSEGILRVRVAAPPVDGSANAALIRFLAGELGTPPSSLRIESGMTARIKRLAVDGVTAAALSERWPGLRLGEGR